jgi:L-fucose isomerase-like protein
MLTLPFASAASDAKWNGPARVRKVYLASQKPSWPRPDVDLAQDKAEIEAQLVELQRRRPGEIEFTGGELLREGTDISAWIEQASQDDAILVFNLTSGLGAILTKVLSTNRPAVLFSRPYAGHSWSNFAGFAQNKMKADVVASSDWGDLDPYVDAFRAIHFMRNSRVLLVSPSKTPRGGDFTKSYGTDVSLATYADLKAAYDAADAGKARKAAEEFTRGALRVVEPSPQEVTDSMRLYHAIASFMGAQKANAIAIDCLGGFARAELPAYPCVAFSKLNDAGMFGVCECDLNSTMTQLLVTSLSRVPGFVSDPVFDTSRNEIIHAHCVSATALAGLDGARSPYIVRSHLEDNKGVSMQVIAPSAGIVTVWRFTGANKLMVSTAEVIGTVDNPRGCRTKIRTRVPDARKFLESYSSGLHRVVFYGDHMPALNRFARLNALELVREV